MTARNSAPPSMPRALNPVSRHARTGIRKSHIAGTSINHGTKSRTCLENSRTGAGSPTDMIDAHIRSFRQSVSLLPPSSISINES